MKMYMIIAMCLLFVLMIGCSEVPEKPQYGRAVNSGLVKTYNDIAIQNAVISQHTLFPYHFVNNAMELNELGDSDLKVLAGHFAKHPGQLNIRRGNISEDLYQDRIDFVLEGMINAGVDVEQISIADGMSGGSGMTSERVIVILQKDSNVSSVGTATQY